MCPVQASDRLQIPEALEAQLYQFRKRVWTVKLIEAVCGTLCAVGLTFLVLFVLDRLLETPDWVRLTLFCFVVLSGTALPLTVHRWIWRNRRLEQLARLLSRKHPQIGDQLLGIVELVRNDFEQARSRTLCTAAVRQVADDASKQDFHDSVPNPRHRQWAVAFGVPLTAVVVLLAVYPAAEINAWARLLAPWRSTPRYTFAAIEKLPNRIVVPHGEAFSVKTRLQERTESKPQFGSAEIGSLPAVQAPLRDGQYSFNLQSQLSPAWLYLRIGDWRQRVHVEPMFRPELTAITATVSLPEYLGLPEKTTKDVRGGGIAPVVGSQIELVATASRELVSAEWNGLPQSPKGSQVTVPAIEVKGVAKGELRWKDGFGLSGNEPFVLSISAREDEPPTVVCEGLPRQKVVLDSEMLSFKAHAHDDFGVKRVGVEWSGVPDITVKTVAKGENLLGAGGHDKSELDLVGTFSAKAFDIEPQLVYVRLFAEDYFPGRKRSYSPTCALVVLNPEQHAIWLTGQLNQWHRQALDVRDRELQLYETNKQLRALPSSELDRTETRRRIEDQALAESANGRRLSHLVMSGEDLVRQASRNPQFGVGHLEKWAEMLQILKDIAGNRMPSVADLLKQASQAKAAVAATNSPNRTTMVGEVRSSAPGNSSSPSKQKKSQPAVPRIADQESSQQPQEKGGAKPSNGQSNPRLTLPVTALPGNGKSSDKAPPAATKMEQAIAKQKDLLAEFEKVADELKRVLAELEGSTLVKRLKAASRLQYTIAGRIGDLVGTTFGLKWSHIEEGALQTIENLAEQETKGSETVSFIMDDMEAFFERHRQVNVKAVLDEMRQQDVVGNLRQLSGDLKAEKGLSIAQCEYWSDALDRWAEDLVDPACCGACPGCKAKGSLPPSVVLEVLQILEGEVNLREQTRTAEQARKSLEKVEYRQRADKLAKEQHSLNDRVLKVVKRIRELPDATSDFAKEIRLLETVSVVMQEAESILAQPETGRPAIGAETEVIELLLQSKRFNPRGGGGGGTNPGGGGRGTTQDSALTLLGSGVNSKEVREDRGISQSTGERESGWPEEFRAGLDEYFNRLERGHGQRTARP